MHKFSFISYNIFPSTMQLIIVPFPSHNMFRHKFSSGPQCVDSTFCCPCYALLVSEPFTLRSDSSVELVIPWHLLLRCLADKCVRFPQPVTLLYVCKFPSSDLKAFITYPLFVKTLCLGKWVNSNEKFLF
jgi:hypothetical protein